MNPVIASITLRGVLGRRRALLLFALPAVLLFFSILLSALHRDATRWIGHVVGMLGVGTIIPLLALIVGTSVIGSEIEDGNILHILSKPISRLEIVSTKWLVASGVCFVFGAIPVTISAVIATGSLGKVALGLGLAAAVGGVVYSALFVWLSVITRRAVPIGLLYILVWELLLANLASGVRNLSIQRYTLRIADQFAHFSNIDPQISLRTAIIMSIVITAATVYFAGRRLRFFSATGELA